MKPILHLHTVLPEWVTETHLEEIAVELDRVIDSIGSRPKQEQETTAACEPTEADTPYDWKHAYDKIRPAFNRQAASIKNLQEQNKDLDDQVNTYRALYKGAFARAGHAEAKLADINNIILRD